MLGPSVAGEKRPKGARFVTVVQGDQVLDEASIARARSLVGLKGYVTNIPAHLMGAGDGRLLVSRAVARPGSASASPWPIASTRRASLPYM